MYRFSIDSLILEVSTYTPIIVHADLVAQEIYNISL